MPSWNGLWIFLPTFTLRFFNGLWGQPSHENFSREKQDLRGAPLAFRSIALGVPKHCQKSTCTCKSGYVLDNALHQTATPTTAFLLMSGGVQARVWNSDQKMVTARLKQIVGWQPSGSSCSRSLAVVIYAGMAKEKETVHR